MSSTAGDYVDAILATRGTSLLVVLVAGVLFALLSITAPNRFMMVVITVLGAFAGWLVGVTYGKRRIYRDLGKN